MAEKIDTKTNEFLYCSCTSSKDNIGEYPELKEILPNTFKYTVCHWRKVDAGHFEVKFRVNVATEDDYDKWLYLFEQSSQTKFMKDKTLPRFKEVVLMSLRCKEMTHVNKPADDAPVRKNADPSTVKPKVYFEKKCTTRIVMIVKLDGFAKVCDIPDVHLDEFPMTVIYHHLHNHPPVAFTPRRSPPPSLVDESMMSEQELQSRQILAELERVERHLQEMAHKQAGHDPETLKIKYNPFSLASFYDAISSINRKYEKHNSSETGSGCLLHFGKDESYSKALDGESLGEWLAVKCRKMAFQEEAVTASTAVADGCVLELEKAVNEAAPKCVGSWLKEKYGIMVFQEEDTSATSVDDGSVHPCTADGETILDYIPECSDMNTNTEACEKLEKLIKEATPNSLSDWLSGSRCNMVFQEEAASGSTSDDDGGVYQRTADGKTSSDYTPKFSYMYTNTEVSEELEKIMKEAILEDS